MLIRNITKITNDSFKKLNEDVNKILLEDIDAVKKVFMNRFPEMSDEEFDEIIRMDPTFKEGSNSVGKYGKWLLGFYKKDYPLDHPLYSIEDIYNLIDVYNQYKNDSAKDIEKDINKFKSIEDLADALRNAGEVKLSARQQERRLRNSKDVKKIFEDSKWEIWVPQSFAGSCTLGKGTNWCTAYSDDDSYYKQYTRQGPLYVFINKQNPKEKYQLHVETESFMNKDDNKANLEDVLTTDDKLREFVYNIYGYKVDKDGNFIYDGNNQVSKDATSVIVEQGVTSIEPHSFADYKSLQSIVIPDSVTEIGGYAFGNCKSLQSVTIPNSVTYIGRGVFDSCMSLQSITIPDSVTYIGEEAFYYCPSLQSIVIPNSITSIGSYTFTFCTSLKSITIPNSVTSIGEGAFWNCESLQSITIPDSVEYIGYRAFRGCDNLKEVVLENPNTKYEKNTFPEYTKIIKKGVNENMKNKKINQLMRAKKLLESKGYKVRRKSLKEAYEYPYFKAYITNLGKYNEGELVGEWVEFPIDEDDFADVLESIGIDGNYYEEWFVTDYDCNLNGFDWQELGEYPSLDDLNEFGELIDDIDSYKLEAINNAYEVTGNLEDAINGINNDIIEFIPLENKTEENVGYYLMDVFYDDIPTYELALEYFDYKRYGRDMMINNRGMFTKDGCILMWR